MVRRAGALVLGLAFIAAAASAVHAIGTPAREPLWAYGFDKAPAYDEPAPSPQNPPTRALRTTESVDSQLRPRHLEGSPLTFPCVGRATPTTSNDDRNIFEGEPGNPRIGWTAYVPVGSVAKGREIVTTGGVPSGNATR